MKYVDHGVSGAKERRSGLDTLLAAVRRREVAVIVVTKLDRLARSLHQLVALGRELEALGVDLVVTDQTVDTTTPAGRLLFHVLGAIADFERSLISDRVVAGLRRAQGTGHAQRPTNRPTPAGIGLGGDPPTPSGRRALAPDCRGFEGADQDRWNQVPRE